MNVPESCGRSRPVDNEAVLSNLEGGAMTCMMEWVLRPLVPRWRYGMLERESSLALGARRSTARRIVLRPAISLSLWFLWGAQNATDRGSGYSKSAGDLRSLHSCPKRRANEICCPFGNLLNPPDLVITDAHRLALR